MLDDIARELGITIQGVSAAPPAGARRIRPLRIGLWDQCGGSMDAGWARWILEQFEFPFTRVFAPRLDAGNLNRDFDALVFVGGAIPGGGGGGGRGGAGGRGGGAGPDLSSIPAEYHDHVGRVSAETTVPNIRAFIEGGGTVVAIGSSAENLAEHLGLPIENHLVRDGRSLQRTEFYAPGSVLRARVDSTQAAAYGMSSNTDFFFDDSPVFRIAAGAATVTPIAWFDSAEPRRSGWAWGEEARDVGGFGGEAGVGGGRGLLYTAEMLKRAQPHGTFPLLFNALLQSGR
jgi:hypothetical protein